MQNRSKDDRHLSSGRCDRALRYMDYERKANCSSTFFNSDERQEKCQEALQKMSNMAERCSHKFK